jgi:hypothetical protein
MRITSIEEHPPQYSYEALLPIEDTHPDWGRSGARSTVEVLSVRGFRGAVPSRVRQSHATFGIVTDVRPMKNFDEVELTLDSPGRTTAFARVSASDTAKLPQDTIVQSPQILMKRGVKLRLRPVTVEFSPDPYHEPWISDVWLPIARVHRPDRDGCMTTLTVTNTKITDYSVGFNFAGYGIGGDVSFSAVLRRTMPASATCKEARVKAKLTVLFGTTLVDGVPVANGARLILSDVDERKRGYADLPKAGHGCGRTEDQLPKSAVLSWWDTTEASGGREDTPDDAMKIGRQTSGSVSVGLDLGKIPLSVSLAYTRTSVHEAELDTWFAPGASYFGYTVPPTNQVEKFWTVVA